MNKYGETKRLGRLDRCTVTCLVGGHGSLRYQSMTTLTGHAHCTKQALPHSTLGGENGKGALDFCDFVSANGSETDAHKKVSYAYSQ